MATITFLSPRRGSGTTTAVAATASALFHSNAEVRIVDRTANEDFSRWWPAAPPSPERVDSSFTLIDAHEPRPDDCYVYVVYDALTEPDPAQWLSALLDEHPHLVIIGAIVNRTNQSPLKLNVPGRPVVRIKPLPHHHLLHDAALQGRWPLDISALSQHHVRMPTLALGPHLLVSLQAAAQFPPNTPAPTPKAPTPETPPVEAAAAEPDLEPSDSIDFEDAEHGIEVANRDPDPELAEEAPPAHAASPLPLPDLDEPTVRKGYSVPTDLHTKMMDVESGDRRQLLSSLIDQHLNTIVPYDADDASERSRLFNPWLESDTHAIRDYAKEHRCKEWQVVSALLAEHFAA